MQNVQNKRFDFAAIKITKISKDRWWNGSDFQSCGCFFWLL